MNPAAFPMFETGCDGNSANCTVGFHQIDCCGSLVAIGINHGVIDQFTPAETIWDAMCGACNCPPAPIAAQDGKTTTMKSSVGVKCENMQCVTFVK
jgi:hypothetical protein